MKLNKRGQSAVEYAVMFVVVIAALLAILAPLQQKFQGFFEGGGPGSRLSTTSDKISYSKSTGTTTKDTTTSDFCSQSDHEIGGTGAAKKTCEPGGASL